ncbi:tetratricopeptide repeat protein [Caulifigura coniformis]|uniref:Tetratricopeptide repeat protein n=1 Tax=Caulifigura coniformis TaxID=2527983 RepID=A0A517SG27_9PLAN|nr:tetratricopeptide repeat protein [Caulifigura coniformis]QDT55060.1 tetratricopeptide repeat protein [Caulifigura coniformis]
MTGFLRRSVCRRMVSTWLLTAMTGLLLPASSSGQDSAKAPEAAPPTPVTRFPGLPVQEGDDPLSLFIPKDEETSDEKLKDEALAWFMTAQLHYSRGENSEGLAALKKTVEKDPSSLTPYRILVPALLDARDLDAARKYALQGAALKPEGIILVQGVALVLTRVRQVDEAIALLQEGLALVPREKELGRYLSLQRQLGALHKAVGKNQEASDYYKLVFDALQAPDSKLSPEQIKDLLGEPGALFDEFGNVFLQSAQPELALKAFDEASKYRPSRPGIHSYNLALLFRDTKKPEQALAELDKYFAAQLQIKGRDAYQLLKDLLTDLKRDGELLGRLEKMKEADTQNAALAYFLADQYVAAGRFDDALAAYRGAPGGARDPRALVGLVHIYRQKKDWPELFSALTRAFPVVDAQDEELTLRFQEEVDAIQKDKDAFDGLVAHARKLQSEDPPKLEFFPAYIMGKLCIDTDRSEDAIGFYRYAISMQNSPPAQLYVDIALHLIQTDKFKPAIEILTEAVQHPSLDDERPYFLDLQIAALEMDGQTDKALEVVTQAKQDYPRALPLISREAWIYYHSQQWEKAIAAYEALIQAGPSLNAKQEMLNTWRFSLSAIYVHLENFDKGESILEELLAKEPENTQANNDLGYLWADRGKNLPRAKIMIEKALAAEPENAAYLDSMGWVQYRLGQFSEAKESLLKAVKDPKRQDATIWDHLGDVYDKLGDKEEAIKAWIKALEIEFEKPKQEEKLVKSLLQKVPADRIPKKDSSDSK